MALVAYDYNSESDADITDEENELNTNLEPESNLFSHLPQAKPSKSTELEENDRLEDFIPTVKTLKEKKVIKITVPCLKDFDDDHEDNGEPLKKRIKASSRGSGLLDLLPPIQTAPKSNTMFVPNTVKKKVALQKKPAIKTPTTKNVKRKKDTFPSDKSKMESDSDTDAEDIPIPDTFDDQMWEKVCSRRKPPKPTVEVNVTEQTEPEVISCAPETKQPYDGLDNVAFKELVGKTKRPLGNIKLIDINEEEILPDRDLWMTKSLTDPELAPKAEPEETLDPTKKRKHHITYLAQQAKANEQEYKAAWATSKNNRMMSRAKYGF